MFLDGKRQPVVDNLRAVIDGWLATEQLNVVDGGGTERLMVSYTLVAES